MDMVGQSLICNANCMQVMIGTSVPFLSLEPNKCTNVDQNNSLGFLWNAIFTLDLHVILPKMSIQTPTSNDNDVILMDKALNDPMICNNRDKMIAVNTCRLYHGLFCLSDMKMYDGKEMDRGFLHGGQGRKISNSNLYKWPNVFPPTKVNGLFGKTSYGGGLYQVTTPQSLFLPIYTPPQNRLSIGKQLSKPISPIGIHP